MATVLLDTWPNEIYHDRNYRMPFVQNLVSQINCPFVTTRIEGLWAYITVANSKTISFHQDASSLGSVYVDIDDVYHYSISWWDNPFTMLIIYSDTFFYIYSYAEPIAVGGGTNLTYIYEILSSDVQLEGYMEQYFNPGIYGNKRHVPIYEFYFRDIDTGILYTHAKMFDYVSEVTETGEETIEFAPDILFDSSSVEITRIQDPNLVTCTTLPTQYRHQVVVFEGKEYFVLETNLLVPLFDQEPEPEPNPEENSD